MRILHLTPFLSGGGAEQQLSYLSSELAARGHEVHIAYTREGPSELEFGSTLVHRLKVSNSHNPRLIWQLVKLIRIVRPNLIQTWMLQMDIAGGLAAMWTRTPWLLREPSSDRAYSPSWKTHLRTQIGRAATAIVSNSSGGDEYWKRIAPNSKRYIIRNGLETTRICKTALVSDLKTSDVPVVLSVGRLAHGRTGRKNLSAFIEALADVRQKEPVFAVICGDGPERSHLHELSHKLGLDCCVHFIGHLPLTSVWRLMRRAAVFVSLSDYEGCPNAVLEAAACECPLVLSDIPAHRELMNEESALFTDQKNIAATARAILLVLRNREQSRERALIAKQKVEGWSITEMARRYESVYEQLLDPKELLDRQDLPIPSAHGRSK